MRAHLILSPGHGGPLFGVDTVPGKGAPSCSPEPFDEGEFNRDICRRVESAAIARGLPAALLTDGACQPTLAERVRCTNVFLAAKSAPALYLAVHANAVGDGSHWHSRHGARVFVDARASQASRDYAERLRGEWELSAGVIGIEPPPSVETRYNWPELRRTHCPAVYLECGYMTHEEDLFRLRQAWSRKRIADVIIEAVWGVAP